MPIPLTLQVYKGDQLVATKDYERDIIKVGRLASAHLCLDDEKVSRIHSVMEVSPDGTLWIIDMGSSEGTYVNGKRVNKGTLAFGDKVRVGNTTIRVLVTTASASASAGVPPLETLEPAPVPEVKEVVVAPRVRPARRKGSGPLGLELRFKWGDRTVGEYFLPPGKQRAFTVGSGEAVDFVMGDQKLGAPKFEVVRADGHGFSLRFTGKMSGELHRHRGDEVLELEQAIETRTASHDGDAYSVHLGSDDFAWVDLGGLTLEVSCSRCRSQSSCRSPSRSTSPR